MSCGHASLGDRKGFPPAMYHYPLLGGLQMFSRFYWGKGLLIGAFISLPVAAQTTIEAYGDSLTAGMLSNSQATNVPSFASVSRILNDFANYVFSGRDPRWIVPHQRADLAWPASLAQILQEAGEPTQVRNVAVSGSKVNELSRQITEVSQGSGQTRAFFFTGHNDMCNNPLSASELAAHFGRAYDEALRRWDAKHEGASAFIVAMGEIHRVYETLDGHRWYRGTERDFTCDDSWSRLFYYCPSHYYKLRNNTLRDEMVAKMRAIRNTLESVVTTWSKQSRKNQFRYVNSTEGATLDKSYFAVDCFHLSERGQSELARTVWQQVQTN